MAALFTLDALRARYAARPESLLDVVEEVLARLAASSDPAIFISRVASDDLRAAARGLLARAPDPASLPLWGVPYAVKDNIDVLGIETTAACPAYAYRPAADATVVARLRAAGALLVGKTNLDQFATGLNGTRSPYGAPRCVFNVDYVSGGSSSGSAVAVASGLVAFALGTDTAGSGRVPAAFNNIVGIKPTPGLVSAAGVVPACRSLDCVNVFAASVGDGVTVRRLIEGFDARDAYSLAPASAALPLRPRVGVLAAKDREFYGDSDCATLYDEAIARAASLGWDMVEFDYAPFQAIAALLYEGPWLAERLAAIEPFLDAQPKALDPTVRGLIEGARKFSAADAFRGQYRLKALLREAEEEAKNFDFMLLPTSPTIHTVAALRADPVRLNAQFGRYTNFVNFCAMAAIAVPSGFRSDGLPFGVTLIASGQCDDGLAPFAAAFHEASGCGAGVGKESVSPVVAKRADGRIEIVVVGAHLAGQPLNTQLTEGGGFLVELTRTAKDYRLYVLPDATPAKPGLVREPGFSGPGLEVEVWSLPPDSFGRFVAAIPAPLGVGKVTLASGRAVTGFLCEAHALHGAREITALGGWRAFLAERS
ncbi:MAG TPA: allophanate hydrolase [Rhodoblastus sp.]|nr:allophanate hydrolase [Rhodoblastus sp.]